MFTRAQKCFYTASKCSKLSRLMSVNSEVLQQSTSESLPGLAESQHVVETMKTAIQTLPDHSLYNVIAHYQSILDTIQVSSSLPWWSVLICTGVVIRTSLIYFNVCYEKRLIKNIPHKVALIDIRKEFTEAKKKNDTVLQLTKLEEQAYYKKKSNYSWKKSENWFLVPTMSAMFINFMSIRGLAELPYQPLLDSSFYWIPSLCQPDPYFILPSLNTLATIYVLKFGLDSASSENPISKLLSSNLNLFIAMAVMGSFQSFFPAALVLYWFSSNLVGLAVIRPVMNNDKSRKFIGLMTAEEKREALKQLPSIESFKKDVGDNYNEVREAGHTNEIKRKEEKLAELENRGKDSEIKIEELKKLLKNLEKKNIDTDISINAKELEKSLKDIEFSLKINKNEVQELKKESFK